jgi:hypothetical protein
MKTNLTEKEIKRTTDEICNFLNCRPSDIALKLCQREVEELIIKTYNDGLMIAHQYGYRIKN